MTYKISREEESRLPKFDSAEEAILYFQERYNDDFVIGTLELIEGFANGKPMGCFFCRLILNHHDYEMGPKEGGLNYLDSYQSIEIMSNGDTHIIH